MFADKLVPMKPKDKVGLGAVIVAYSAVLAAAAPHYLTVDTHEVNVESFEAWVVDDPVLKDLTFTHNGSPTEEHTKVEVAGVLHVDSVPEFFDALARLGEMHEEKRRDGVANTWAKKITATIGGTTFDWQGAFPDRERAREGAEVFAPFASPCVAEVKDIRMRKKSGFATIAKRNMAVSDDEARAFRDEAYRHLEKHRNVEFGLMGFPLAHPARELNKPGMPSPLPSLGFTPDGATYAELVEQAEHVDAATDMFLYRVNNNGRGTSEWTFYTEGDFDEEGLRAIKEILSEPVDGKDAMVIIESSEGVLGKATVGRPDPRSAYDDKPWTQRMEDVLSK